MGTQSILHQEFRKRFFQHLVWMDIEADHIDIERGRSRILRPCVIKEQFWYMLYPQVVPKKVDDHVAVRIMRQPNDCFIANSAGSPLIQAAQFLQPKISGKDI
jgi:hypothetical protein